MSQGVRAFVTSADVEIELPRGTTSEQAAYVGAVLSKAASARSTNEVHANVLVRPEGAWICLEQLIPDGMTLKGVEQMARELRSLAEVSLAHTVSPGSRGPRTL